MQNELYFDDRCQVTFSMSSFGGTVCFLGTLMCTDSQLFFFPMTCFCRGILFIPWTRMHNHRIFGGRVEMASTQCFGDASTVAYKRYALTQRIPIEGYRRAPWQGSNNSTNIRVGSVQYEPRAVTYVVSRVLAPDLGTRLPRAKQSNHRPNLHTSIPYPALAYCIQRRGDARKMV